MNAGEPAHTVFFCALHSRLGGSATGAHFEHRSTARTWRELKNELEQRLLGRSMEADYALEQRNRAQRRNKRSFRDFEQRPHQQQLKAKVVGSSRENASTELTELRERATVLPWLAARALLEPGDILVLWRLPRLYDTLQRIYNRKAATAAHSAKNVPNKYRHLLRLQLAEASQAGVMLGEHQWLADHAVVAAEQQNNENTTGLQFDESMNEDQRIALLTERATKEYGVTADEQERAWVRGAAGDGRRRNKRQCTARPPDNYVCVRCNVPGHWVQDCPTRHDERFEPRNILSTNGISRSRLRRVYVEHLADDFDGQLYKDQEGRFYVQHHDTTGALREQRTRQIEAQFLLNPGRV